MKAKLLAKRSDLYHAVVKLMPAIPANALLDVLSYIEVKPDVEKNILQLSSTDLEVRISVRVPAQITLECEEPEALFSPARIFADLLAISEGEQIVLMVEGKHLQVQNGASKTKIALFGEDEFPPDFEMGTEAAGIALYLDTFKSALQRVLIAASTDETRLNLNALQLCVMPDEIRLTATDGFRLATERVSLLSQEEQSE